MLEITLLKTRHVSEIEAKKLTSHILECDVFGPECMAYTEKLARMESNHHKHLMSLSRTAALKSMSKLFEGQHEESIRYRIKLTDSLLRNAKPVIVLERFDERETSNLCAKYAYAQQQSNYGLEELSNGNINAYLQIYGRSMELKREFAKARDVHIAGNLSKAEGWIIEENPEFAKMDRIRFTFELGNTHSVEKYSGIKMDVVNLALTPPVNIITPIIAKLYQLERPADSARDLLAFGLCALARDRRIAQVEDNKIIDAPFEELSDILKSKIT